RGRLQPALAAALDRVFACLDAGDGMVILEYRAAVTDGTWRLTGIFQGRLNKKYFDYIGGVILGVYGKIGHAKGSFALLKVLASIAELGVPFKFLFMPTGSSHLLDRFFKGVIANPALAARSWYVPPCAPWKVPRFLD
ncbi:hypothetical protein QT894_10205, partial [Xanthomonas fragariae]|nr:hypothetical protein [Xanthomonas fragariae]MDM7581951.1 hypothetical protein [Xanthomonas fragariae]